MPDDAVPPEALLIRRARMARGMSPEDAAPLTAVIGSRRWRQIEQGQAAGDDVLAHMAFVVRASPEQLKEAGRGEAAEVLREIERQSAPAPDLSVLTEDEQRILASFIKLIQSRMAERDQEGKRGA